MNLKAAPIEFEIEFRLELAEDFEADVTEGTNEVGVHLDFERHGVTSIKRYNGGARGVKSARACAGDIRLLKPSTYISRSSQSSLARLASSPSDGEVSGFPLGLTFALLG
jgi:hypothetical protein